MAILSDNPVTLNTTFDKYWVKQLVVQAQELDKPVKVFATLCRYDGQRLDSTNIQYSIQDLFALAAQNQAVAAMVDNLLTTIGNLAKAAGKIS